MIIDAHCHAWARWPYQPTPPDPGRGDADVLLFSMDELGIARAVVICASIGGNPVNARDVCAAAARSAGRLIPFIDVDCRWHATHHQAGAAGRLQRAVAEFAPAGITHYMDEEADASWLHGADGLAFLRAAAERHLLFSLACGPAQLPAIMHAAAQVPDLPILLHHLIRVRAGDTAALRLAVSAASQPNLHLKLSGFGYGVTEGWNYPLTPMREIARALFDAYGPDRVVWGSDWPVSTRYMTHRQSLEIVRRLCDFITPDAMPSVLGGTMARLLGGAR